MRHLVRYYADTCGDEGLYYVLRFGYEPGNRLMNMIAKCLQFAIYMVIINVI